MVDVEVLKIVRIIIGEVEFVELNEFFVYEKFFFVFVMYKFKSFEDVVVKVEKLVVDGGYGYIFLLYVDFINYLERVEKFVNVMKICRVLVNILLL